MLPYCLLGSSTEQMHDNLESLFYMIKKQNVVKGYEKHEKHEKLITETQEGRSFGSAHYL